MYRSRFPRHAALLKQIIDETTGGKQREFARKIGAAQPVISRVLAGKQDVSDGLVKRMQVLRGQVPDALLDSFAKGQEARNLSAYQVPMTKNLVSGVPNACTSSLLGREVEVPASLFRSNVYAIEAKNCLLEGRYESMNLLPADIIVIESITEEKSRLFELIGNRVIVAKYYCGQQVFLGLVNCQLKFFPELDQIIAVDVPTTITGPDGLTLEISAKKPDLNSHSKSGKRGRVASEMNLGNAVSVPQNVEFVGVALAVLRAL